MKALIRVKCLNWKKLKSVQLFSMAFTFEEENIVNIDQNSLTNYSNLHVSILGESGHKKHTATFCYFTWYTINFNKHSFIIP